MQRKSEERQAAHAGQGGGRLRLRGHAAAERLAAGEQRKLRQQPRGFGDRGAHGGVRELGRVGPLAAFLHVGELVAQGRDAALGEFRRDRRHEGVRHAGAGAMRQHIAGARVLRRLQQAGDARGVVDGDGDGLCAVARPATGSSWIRTISQ